MNKTENVSSEYHNGHETERHESLCVGCNTETKIKSDIKYSWNCDKCIAPKGKKAVTLYIPEGMSAAEAIMKASYLWVNVPDGCSYNPETETEEYVQKLSIMTDQQIQEAIDKLSQEKDA